MTGEARAQGLATVGLFLAAVIWGLAFVAQRAGMQYIGPFAFNGIRFLLGCFILLPLWIVRSRRRAASGGRTHRLPFGAALLTGGVLFAAASLQQVGLVYAGAGKAGFFTGLYVVLVPILGLALGQRPQQSVWAGAALAAGGTYLLFASGASTAGTASQAEMLGDVLLLSCAVAWAVHVQLVGWLARRSDPLFIAVTQNAVCGGLSLSVSAAMEPTTAGGLVSAVPALLFAGVISVGVAYTLQIVGQQRVDPTRAGIIVSLESVFAALGGWALLGERLSPAMLAGCGLMFLGMVSAQWRGRRRSAAAAAL